MIGSLKGVLLRKMIENNDCTVIVDVNGVGYEAVVPLRTFSNLPEEGHGVFLHIQTIVREDDLFLCGFSTEMEKEVFSVLRLAKGVGVKTAFALLSSYDAEELMGYIVNEEIDLIVRVPGIGKKTAERIVFELKDRAKKFIDKTPPRGGVKIEQDVELALVALGYNIKDAREAVNKAAKQHEHSLTIEEIIKETLKYLVKR